MVHFEDNGCKIYDDKREKKQLMIYINIEKNKNFSLILHYAKNVVWKIEANDESWLWHKRYRHLNFQSLRSLHQKNMVYGLPTIQDKKEIYEECVLRKQH